MCNEKAPEVIKVTAFAICNMALIDDRDIMLEMIQYGLVNLLERCFDLKGSRNIISSLEALDKVLKVYTEQVRD